MGFFAHVATIARWELRRTSGSMGKKVLPVAIVLVVLMVAATGFAAQRGLHLQDNLFHVGVDDRDIAAILSADERFAVLQGTPSALIRNQESLDIVITGRQVYVRDSERGRAALLTLERDYTQYCDFVYRQEEDLFAAYPLWIDLQTVKSELDFSSTQSGTQISAVPATSASSRIPPVPEGVVEVIPTPEPGLGLSTEEVRTGLEESGDPGSPIARYTDVLGPESPFGSFRTPSQLSPPLPFDSIVLMFLFIFPIYFASQFFTMSIMQERIGRAGETLLSSPAGPSAIILGKAAPYFLGIMGISAAIILYLKVSPLVLLPLLPVILFFFTNALVIGMVSRSFRELSFVSLFFATLVTSYLLFPSIFANVHVISLVSPLTLIVLTLQNEPYTLSQYAYSTSLFYLTSAALFYVAVVNYHEERLFSLAALVPRVREFISAAVSKKYAMLSLFSLNALAVPFVFMVQMMLLVLFFNLPIPLSLILLIISAAFVEEIAKSIGITTLILDSGKKYSWKGIALGSLVTAGAFLFAEKLLLFVTLSQISESVFGNILFLSLGALTLPFLLHVTGTLISASFVRWKGTAGYVPGIFLASTVHCLYNAYFILGVVW